MFKFLGHNSRQTFLILACVLVLCACKSTSSYHELGADSGTIEKDPVSYLFGLEQPFVREYFDKNQVLALTEQQQKAFMAYYNAPENQSVAPHKRLAYYVENIANHFNYHEFTYSASQALDAQKGNCLSLAAASVALASLVDLPFKLKQVYSEPVYSKVTDVQLISVHINLLVFNNQALDHSKLQLRDFVILDYFKTGRSIEADTLSIDDLHVMYWQNLAADAIVKQQYKLAYSHVMMAHDLDNRNPETLNQLAIIYRRIGQTNKAYALYDYMSEHDIYSFSVLDNFSAILKGKGEFERAERLKAQIADITEENPFTWLNLAEESFEQQKYVLAELYVKKSIKRGPYLHEPQFLLAKLYAKTNNKKALKQALEQAQKLANLPADKKRYQAKLYSLNY